MMQEKSQRFTIQDKEKEIKYYGVNACQVLFNKRAQAIVRVYVAKERIAHWGSLLKWSAAQKKAYHLVSNDDLAKIAGTLHHEGVCILAKMSEVLNDQQFLLTVTETTKVAPLLYLDSVANPHNFGALLRVASHFGVSHILGAKGELQQPSSSALRIAEGGAESLQLVYLSAVEKSLRQLKSQGFTIVATSSHQGSELFKTSLAARCVFIMGAEQAGISERLMKLADVTVAIPGSGAVESLNVATASAVLLAEHWRQHGG